MSVARSAAAIPWNARNIAILARRARCRLLHAAADRRARPLHGHWLGGGDDAAPTTLRKATGWRTGPFTRLAVINRGEAAVRLIHAVRELNDERDEPIRIIALYTAPERHAMFVRLADEAVFIGPARP